MPTRKQRRREAKAKRHEYEFVYVDDEGNEVVEVPEETTAPKVRDERRNGSKPSNAKSSAKKPAQQTRGGRANRVPPEPSWNRALKRGGMLGVIVFVLFSFTAKGNYIRVIPLALLYTALFVPFTFAIDRFAYRRWQAKQQAGPPPKKR